jgi:hypothetical protein
MVSSQARGVIPAKSRKSLERADVGLLDNILCILISADDPIGEITGGV